jgi:AcrR family transcriptional regulator
MPKKTFENLNSEKKDAIILAFLHEFTTHTYDDASLSSVVKKLGIAKGSVYQYFNDKLDLFTYLISECNKVKMKYTSSCYRESYDSFWDYFKSVIRANIKFDKDNPLHSIFLFCLEDNLNSKSTRHLFVEYKSQTLLGYNSLVTNEVSKGNFRNDISTDTLSYYLYTTSLSINRHFATKYNIDFRQHAEKGESIFDNHIEDFNKIIKEHLLLLETAFRKE